MFGWAGWLAEAFNVNKKAVDLVLEDAQAHSNLGITLKKLGRLDEAEASYNQASALNPNCAEAHRSLHQ